MEVACTPGAPDQLHAIESATKIGARPTPAQADALELYAQTLAEHDVVFVRWLLWSAHPPKDEVGLVTHWLKSDDPVTRLRAAYIQRWLHPRQLAVRAALADAADRATEANLSTAIVVSAACLVEPDHPHRGAWLQTLKRCAASTDATQRYHALQGLMKSYDEGKLPVLVAMLDDPQPDIRIGAAWSILDIAQRRTDSLRIIKPHSP
jgi:hypothetical protein